MESASRASFGRISFGPFSLTPGERLLTQDGALVDIGGRSLDLLIALVEQPGRVLHKQDLLKRVWPDVVVEDSSLRFHMANLRKILGDGKDGARYISTQAGVGYAFVAPLEFLPIVRAESGAERESESMLVTILPPRPVRVIGRDQEVRLLCERLVDTRLFTIVGPGGVGKTTLALETAHACLSRFADKASFVDLATLEYPALIPSAIAGALGIAVQGEDPMTVVLRQLRSRELLLILDNCEHLIDAVSAIVERISDAAPRVSILATSRELLRARGEHVHWLNPLDYPRETGGLSLDELLAYPAVELFIERASAGNSALGVDAEAARLIADMCRQLDGMALPIELTAVRVAAHGLRATSALLGERFSLGWAGRRTAVPRQQTLQATLDWSYELLSEPERLTLERLSVFLGFFSLDCALSVVTDATLDAGTAATALDELTAKSLLSPNRSSGTSCYRLLEMTRAYAKQRLLARGAEECNATSRRHATRFLKLLEARNQSQQDFQTDATHFSQMLGNIRTALEWSFGLEGDLAIAVPLAAASVRVFMTLSLLVECRTWSARAVRDLGDSNSGTATELELQAALGLSLMFTGGNSGAAELALLLLIGAAVAMAVMYVRAEHARAQAEENFNNVRALSRYVLFDVYDRLESVPRALMLRRDIAEKGQQYLDHLSRDPGAPAALRLEVAEGLRRLSLVQGGVSSASLSDEKLAKANLARAEQIARALPDDAEHGRERAFAIARILTTRSRLSTAVALDLEATKRDLDAAEAALAPWRAKDPADQEARDLSIDLALERIAQLFWQGKYQDAIAAARQGISLEPAVTPVEPEARREALRRHARLLDGLAESIYYTGDLPGAVATYREHYTLVRRLAQEEPQNLRTTRMYARAGWVLGGTLVEMGPDRQAEAEQLLSKSLEVTDNLQMLEPDDKDLLRMRSVIAASEAQALAGLGRAKDAVTLMEEAVRQRRTLWNAASGDWAIARDVATSLDLFGDVLVSAREIGRACAAYQESLDVFEQMRAAGRLAQLDQDTIQKDVRDAMKKHCPSDTARKSPS